MSQSVVVTGCGTGIGAAIALRLAHDRWFVIGVERDAQLAALAGERLGRHGAIVCGDVIDRAVFPDAATRAPPHAPLVGWVNNAAVALRGTLREPKPARSCACCTCNLEAVLWGCAEAVDAFRAHGRGAIVNMSSIHGRAGFPGSDLHPLMRIEQPRGVALLVAFLLSDAASFVCGQSTGLYGGATARCEPRRPGVELIRRFESG